MSTKLIVLLFYCIFGIEALTTSQLQIAKSISDESCRKQILIVEHLLEESELYKLVGIVKYFSNYHIYTKFLSIEELDKTLHQLATVYNFKYYEYRPKTMVLVDEYVFDLIAKLFLSINYEFVTAKLLWVTFGNSVESLMDKMKQSYVPYDCQVLFRYPKNDTDYEIIEIYQINNVVPDFNLSYFGNWNENKGLNVPVNDFYARRYDLNGTVFGALVDCQYVKGDLICATRDGIILSQIVDEISRMMNFRTIRIFTNNNNSYEEFYEGYPNSNVEISMETSFVFDSFNFDSFDFIITIIPLWKIRYYLHLGYNKKYEIGDSSPFLRPFTQNLWFSIAGWILGSTIILLLINYGVYKYRKSKIFDFFDVCFTSFESFTTQDGSGTTSESESPRMAIFSIQIPPLFLVLAYSCIIISFVTVRNIQLPLQNLEDLVKDGNYKIGYDLNTYPKIWFQRTNNPVAKSAYQKFALAEEEMPPSTKKGVEKMCEDFKYSHISFDDTLFLFTYNCQPLQIPMPLFASTMGINLRHSSPYESIFKKMVNSVRSTGVLNAMRSRVLYYDTESGSIARNTKNFLGDIRFEVDTVDWDDVKSIFILLGITYLMSISILISELFLFFFVSKTKTIQYNSVCTTTREVISSLYPHYF